MTAPIQLPRFEYQLVRLARFFVGQLPAEAVVATLGQRFAKPDGISGPCRKLIEQSLAKGSVLRLARTGGWRPDSFLRKGTPKTGRVWQRGALKERQLLFTKAPMDFLVWMQTAKINDTRAAWNHDQRLSAADEFFFHQVYETLAENAPVVAEQVRSVSAIRHNPLVRLCYPDDFADEVEAPDYSAWVQGVRSVMIECLQPHLQKRWLKLETTKPQETVWLTLRKKSEAQERTLAAYLADCWEAKRPDLARFVLATAKALLAHPGLTPADWTVGLNADGAPPRLADRLAVQRSSLGFLRQLHVLQNWDREARAVGYLDEEYAASQLWKRDWEQHNGTELCQRAARLLEQLEPLRAG
jgi:FtsH ternary system domain X6